MSDVLNLYFDKRNQPGQHLQVTFQSFDSLRQAGCPTSNKLVVVVLVLGNVHTFKHGAIWK